MQGEVTITTRSYGRFTISQDVEEEVRLAALDDIRPRTGTRRRYSKILREEPEKVATWKYLQVQNVSICINMYQYVSIRALFA